MRVRPVLISAFEALLSVFFDKIPCDLVGLCVKAVVPAVVLLYRIAHAVALIPLWCGGHL